MTTNRKSRAKTWPKEVNGLRLDAIAFAKKASKELRRAREATIQAKPLVALDCIASAEVELVRFENALTRAGDALGNADEVDDEDAP